MNVCISLILLVVEGYILITEAAIKEPGWKHCIHPAHALPNQWGKIVSPGFPKGINTQIQCSWMITANPGYRVKLAFHTLNVTGSRKSCFTQFVEIIDFKVGHSMGKFCGASRPGDYVSWGPRVRFDLQGDTSGEKTKGFDLRYKATREPGGFKQTWSFPLKPKSSKGGKSSKGKKKPSKSRRPGGGRPKRPTGGASRPKGPAPVKKGTPGLDDSDAPESENQDKPEENQEAKSPKQQPQRPQQQPQRPHRPQQARPPPPNRIEFRQPISRRPGPIIYGERANARGVDHGHSNVIHVPEEEEPEFNLYVIIGIAVGGVIILVVIIVIAKLCIFDKNKKRRMKQRKEEEQRSKDKNSETGENIQMGMVPGMVSEQYINEQMMPQHQSYHRFQSLPAMPQPHPVMYPYAQSVRSGKAPSVPPMYPVARPHSQSSRVRSSRSRSRSRQSTRRSKSRASMRSTRPRSSMSRKRSRSLQYIPSNTEGWIRVNEPQLAVPMWERSHPPESDTETFETSSSSDFDSDDTQYYQRRKPSRRKRARSMSRVKSQPPPYDQTMAPPYYVIDKSRDYDEGYDTGKVHTIAKSTSGKSRKSDKRKSGKRGRKRKNSY